MRILHINKFYYRRRGAETYVFDVMELQRQHGHEVEVFAMQHPNNEPSTYQAHFADNVELSGSKKYSPLQKARIAKNILWNTQAAKQLAIVLDHFKPDIVHIHNIYHQLSPSLLPEITQRGIPVVMTLHDYKLLAPNYTLLAGHEIDLSSKGGTYYKAIWKKSVKNSYVASAVGAAEMYLHKWMQVYEKHVDLFISPSQFLANLVRDWSVPVKHIQVLPNFLDVSAIVPETQPGQYVLYAGGLTPEKGVDMLVRAWGRLVKQPVDNNAKTAYSARSLVRQLRIAGDGTQRSELEQLVQELGISDSVTFVGALTKSEVVSTMQGAYCVVIPSRYYDNYPYITLEAFATGKPVVATNLGGLPEQVTAGQTGWLTEPRVEDLSATLLSVLRTSPEDMQRMGAQARQWVEQRANPQDHYNRLMKEYDRVM